MLSCARLLPLVALLALACSPVDDDQPPAGAGADAGVTEATGDEGGGPAAIDAQTTTARALEVGRSDLTPQGNRVAAGAGALDRVDPVDVVLPGVPVLVLPVLGTGEPGWLVELGSGARVVVESDGAVDEAGVGGTTGSAGTDPRSDQFTDPLPDGRVVESGDVIVSLVGPTDRYPHGVLGDRVEASAVEVVDQSTGASAVFGPEAPTVIEGISPLLADLTGDGAPEVLVTQSNAEVGAWLAVWALDGRLVAESEPIGQGNRWRNQLAVAAVGPAGEIEVIDVRTPHLGGTVEYFRLEGDELVEIATQRGFTSHVIGSRNLDLGIVADADGNGSLDVVLPTDDRTTLGVLSRAGSGVDVVATVALPGRLTTNVAVSTGADGALTFAVGTDGGVLRIWPSG